MKEVTNKSPNVRRNVTSKKSPASVLKDKQKILAANKSLLNTLDREKDMELCEEIRTTIVKLELELQSKPVK